MTRSVLVVIGVVIGLGGVLAQGQVRDLRKEPTGTGAIGGVVQTDETSARPLRRATVRLTSERLMTARIALTRDDGTFVFDGLAAGQYSVSANRLTYMTAEFGARRPGGTGSAVVLAEGQRRTDLVLRLSRWGSISGTIYDQDGAPASGISVEALRYTMRTGRRTLSSVYGQPTFTDDRGAYDLGGLAPGQYFIATGPSPDRGPMDLQRLTVADVDRALKLFSAPAATTQSFSHAERHQTYAPVYFPGSTDFSQAQLIEISLGEQRKGVDLRLELVPTARVDGTVTGVDGQPVTAGLVTAAPVVAAQSLDLFGTGAFGYGPLDAQGRFTFPALAPGRYVVSTRVPPPVGSAGLGSLWASTEVVVAGADQTVALTLQPGMSVSGRVIFDGKSLQPPANLSTLRASLPNIEALPMSSTLSATLAADGTFAITGVSPARYRFTMAAPVSPPGWALRSAVANGVDLLDGLVQVTAGRNLENVVVTFTDRPSELSGTLQTTAGVPTADYFIVVFAADRSYWVPSSRRNVAARPASTGTYVVRNLPPGDYLVVAVTDVEQNQWLDPAFLEKLAPAATKITLAESEKRTLDLKIAGPAAPKLAK